ncbi:MAG: hypothetical protein RH862_11710 [Leptospiraceae bacterium]
MARTIYIVLLLLSLGLNVFLGIRTALFEQTLNSRAINAALADLERNREKKSPTSESGKPNSGSQTASLPPAGFARLFLRGVRFYWTDSIYVDIEKANVLLKSLTSDGLVDFDAPDNLEIHMQQASVQVNYSVLEHILNENVFGHPDSHVRNMVIDSVNSSRGPSLRIRGELELVTFLDFEMEARIGLADDPGILEVEAVKITSLGLPFVQGLMGTVGMDLESLIVPADGSGVTVQGNRILIRLSGLFPSPAVFAHIDSLELNHSGLALKMKGNPLPASLPYLLPEPSAIHYLYAAGRFVKFGPLRLIATSLQMIDQSAEDMLHFHMRKYFTQLDRSPARVMLDGRVQVFLVDYGK